MAKPRRPQLNELASAELTGDFAIKTAEHLFVLLSQVAHCRERRLEARLAPLGLSLQHWRCSVVIFRVADCSMSDLRLFSMIDRTTLTRSIDQLADRGLVERYVAPNDRRLVLLRLSESGRELFRRALKEVLDLNAEIIARVGPIDQESLARTMEQLLGALIDVPDHAEDIVNFTRPKGGSRSGS